MLSVGQESSTVWLGPLLHRLSKGCNQSVGLGVVVSSEGSTGEGAAPKLTHMVVGRVSVHWTEGFWSLLALGQRLPSVPCQVALSIRISTSEEPERECHQDRGNSFLLSIFGSDIPSLCHLLLVGSKALNSFCTQVERITQGPEYQDYWELF